MRKQRLTLNDWSRIPTVEVKSEGRPSLRKFQAEEARREQEIATRAKAESDARTKELEDEFNKGFRELNKVRLSTLYTLPSAELAGRCMQREVTGSVQTTADEISKAVLKAAQTAFAGIDIKPSGRDKIIRVLNLHPTLDTTKPETWTAVFEYMKELRAFTDEDVTQTQPVPGVIQPEPSEFETQQRRNAAFDAILDSNSIGSSRNGNQVIKQAVNREFAKSIQSGYAAFEEQCRQRFNDYFTTEEIQGMSGLLTARNLNGTSPKGWHEARILAVRAGYVRDKFLNADEQLAWDVDRGRVDTSSFEGRRAFNRRVAEIHGETPLLS